MREFWKWFGVATLAVTLALAVGFLLPIFGRTAIVGVQTKSLSNAMQWGTAARIYAEDHEGHFPMHLSQLVPEYMELNAPTDLLFEVREDSKGPAYAKQDWLYFGAYLDQKNPPPILIASPQATGFNGKPPKRVVIHGDGSGEVMNESEYQADLRKTIEAMSKRAKIPVSKPDPAKAE